MIIRLRYKKITGMEGSVSNDTSNQSKTDESIEIPKKMYIKKDDSLETSPAREPSSIKISLNRSSDTSDKDSSNDNISIKSKEIINPENLCKKIREITIDSCDYVNQNDDQYFLKVDNLRQDIQKVLSKWIMTVRDQVQDNFYENVRVAFDDFIQEIENYNNSVKSSSKKSHSKKPSSINSYKKSKVCSKEIKTEDKSTKSHKPQSKQLLGNSIEMVDRINVRLQHLIDMLSRFNMSHCHVASPKLPYKKDDPIKVKSKNNSFIKEETVDEVVNHTIKKLKKYSAKHGLASVKHKNPRTTSLKKPEPCINSDGCTTSNKSLKRQSKISPGDKLQFEMWLKSQSTTSNLPTSATVKSSDRKTRIQISKSTEFTK